MGLSTFFLQLSGVQTQAAMCVRLYPPASVLSLLLRMEYGRRHHCSSAPSALPTIPPSLLLEGPDICDILGTGKLWELGSLEETSVRIEPHLFSVWKHLPPSSLTQGCRQDGEAQQQKEKNPGSRILLSRSSWG